MTRPLPKNSPHRYNNKFHSPVTRMAISVSKDHYDLIKQYAEITQESMSKAILDNLNIRRIKEVVKISQQIERCHNEPQ